MITRDAVQGFIDGHNAAGHSKECLQKCLKKWLSEHPQYKPDEESIEKIVGDLGGYRQ